MGWNFRQLIKKYSEYEGNKSEQLIQEFTDAFITAIMKDYNFSKEIAVMIATLALEKWLRFEDVITTTISICGLLYMQYSNTAFEISLK